MYIYIYIEREILFRARTRPSVFVKCSMWYNYLIWGFYYHFTNYTFRYNKTLMCLTNILPEGQRGEQCCYFNIQGLFESIVG